MTIHHLSAKLFGKKKKKRKKEREEEGGEPFYNI